jgi:hypothetical protein
MYCLRTAPVLLAAAAAVFIPFALTAEDRAPGGSSIEGTVKLEASGRPLARVRVAVKKLDAKQSVTTITDEAGRFAIGGLPTGVYTLTADREGYLRASTVYEGQQASQSLNLYRSGHHITNLVVRMRPGAAISGTVRFHDGDPAIGVPVQVYLVNYTRPEGTYTLASAAVTNDLGEYRVHSLPPGSYYIVARMPGGYSSENRAGAVPTFYLEGAQLNQGVAVRLMAGQVVANCDIVLNETRTYRISGRVISGVSGSVLRGPAVGLRWLDVAGIPGVIANQMEASQGRFDVTGVAPGQYELIVEGSENGKKLSARQTLTVTDGPIDELEVVAGPVRRWSGTVRFDGITSYDISSLQVRLEPRSDESPVVAVNVNKQGAFQAELVPDETYDAFVDNAPADSYLKSAMVNGGETLGSGFQVGRSQDERDIELVLAVRGGSVSGNVRTAQGSAAPGVLVVLLPQPITGQAQAVVASYSDESGLFVVRGLPPGQYLAVAWPSDSFCGPYDPSPPSECTAGSQGVRVGGGDVSGVRLTLAQ